MTHRQHYTIAVQLLLLLLLLALKASYNNHRGELTRIFAQRFRVKFLAGPCAGTEKDFPKASVTKFIEAPDPAESESKRARTAEEIFGTLAE